MKLEIGKEYWLDCTKKDSGIFVAEDERALYFKPVVGKFYSRIEYDEEHKGLIPFINRHQNFIEV